MHLVHHLSVLFVDSLVRLRAFHESLLLSDKCVVASCVLFVRRGEDHSRIVQFSATGGYRCPAEHLVERSHVPVSQMKLRTYTVKKISIGQESEVWGDRALESLREPLKRSAQFSLIEAWLISESQSSLSCLLEVDGWLCRWWNSLTGREWLTP